MTSFADQSHAVAAQPRISSMPYFGHKESVGSETVKDALAIVIAFESNGTPMLWPAVAVIVVIPQARPEVATPFASIVATSAIAVVQATCLVMSRVSVG